jgi:protein-L-isoaspartate(D-aspartate) O-methyltransferase
MAGGDQRIASLVLALRRLGITDTRVLSAIEKTPRECFVAEPFRHAAYDNTALPIPCGQTISQPYVVATATHALDVHENMRVLEIGCGSGYQAAVLSHLCRRVYTVERHKPLLLEAEARFRLLRLDNVTTWHGDGFKGWPEQAPFDRILLSAALPEVPVPLIEQLKPDGILVAPVGPVASSELNVPIPVAKSDTESICQLLTKIIRRETGIEQEALIPVVFVPMMAGMPRETRTPNGRKDSKV